ncbi:MAG TPA: 1-acyl-sn-glycerol-3-phosphate acyltransferase [Firmicutes bacterium]|nr:1-acyl-sn-glycerol-3-phosphate acyltransferase [Bacillota bacterium]
MLYWLARGLIRLLAGVFLRWEIEGAENLPSEGPVLLAINHLSAFDPLLGGSAVNRKVHFMAKEELFRSPLLAALLRRLGAFPVRRGESDRQALRQALRLLEQGEVVGIFPEGTRSPDGRLQQAQTGLAFLAQRARAAVVPMAILGSRGLLSGFLRPGKVRIVIGQRVYAPEGGEDDSAHERHRRFADEVMGRINALLAAAEEARKGR